MRSTRVVAAVGVLVLTIAGCGSSGSAPSSSAPVPTGAVTSAPPQTTSPSNALNMHYGDAPTSASPAQPSGDLSITDVRAGSHTGSDRVVIELTGGQPGELAWQAEYDNDPRTQGKGDAIGLPGSATLRISVHGLVTPPPAGVTPNGLQPNSAHGKITGVYVDPVFEGEAHVYIGLDARRDFHVVEFDSPTRIVIDINNTATASGAPNVPYGDVPTSANPAGASSNLLITDVRAGAHPGYDRVVIELTGGEPDELAWQAEYDNDPRTQGKGDAIDLPGSATLRVSVYGVTYPPAGTSTPSGLQANSAHGKITGVYVDPVFEGQAHVYIGLDARRGFHIVEFDSPTRIVVDVQQS